MSAPPHSDPRPPSVTGIEVLTSAWREVELLDSGDRRKLERFGSRRVIRPEPKAWWKPAHPEEWRRVDATLDDAGVWSVRPGLDREWTVERGRLRFRLRLADTSRHVGVFPEQEPHWDWIRRHAPRAPARPPQLLNLFGYTGAATLAAAAAGFAVTHVDASKPALAWARHNQELSGLSDAPIRWLLDDAGKFVARELRRRKRYDAILLDPPSFGRGPRNELWKVERRIVELLDECRPLLSDRPLFLILTMYNLEASSLMVGNLLADTFAGAGGRIEVGELALRHADSQRLLPLSIFGRWHP